MQDGGHLKIQGSARDFLALLEIACYLIPRDGTDLSRLAIFQISHVCVEQVPKKLRDRARDHPAYHSRNKAATVSSFHREGIVTGASRWHRNIPSD